MTDLQIFKNAPLNASAEEMKSYLDGACGGDATLLARVEALFQAEAKAGGFMERPALDGAPRLLASSPVREGPGTQIGRFKLLQEIGAGGFGVVYMAEQKEPVKRRVALKIIKIGMDTEQVVARFEAERQALAMMDHPNIARVLDAGATDTGRPYFVMELVKGVRITEYCDESQLTTRERLELFLPVCQAIQHAHQKGIIHRDIKPSNVMVTLHDGVPVPKVIDFGIAKATQAELTEKTIFTQYGQFIGTPAYMSPEQAEMSGLDIDTRSDIYSLGVLLYELLVGRTPLDSQELLSGGVDELRRRIKEEPPTKPSTCLRTLAGAEKTTAARHRNIRPEQLSSELTGDLDWIVLKALEKDRTRRYETVNGLAADLKRHLNNEPVTARPPSTAYRFQKAWRRNKLAFTAATAVAVTLVAGIGVSTWQAFVATKARRIAQAEQQRADAEGRKAAESEERSRRFLYASDMNLARQSLKLNNLGRARRLLDRHRPQPGEEDLRGWEWRYLWQLTRSSALLTLTNRPADAVSISFSPDGSRLAVGWWEGLVDLWDVPARRWVRALTDREKPHRGRVAFSPVRNLLAATSEPKVVALYDLDSGRESILWRAPDQAEWRVKDLSFSPDGSRVVIYTGSTADIGDAVWVVNVSSSEIESRHSTFYSGGPFHGTAQLSPDNRRLYLARSDSAHYRCTIQCLDLSTGQELWQTEPQRDRGITKLALSPDGRLLASGSGYEDPSIRVRETATGRFLARLEGHTSWVSKLAFTKDGRRLISAATDQTIRLWDTSDWTETKVLRGHTDEVHAVAISEAAQLVASASKDGDIFLWQEDGKSATDGYSRLPENLQADQVLPLDQSRALLLSPGQPPEMVDLKNGAAPAPLPEISSSTHVLGCFGANLLCYWNGTNQILVRELHGAELTLRGAITLVSGTRPTGVAYSAKRQLLAWAEGTNSASVYLGSLAASGHRMELESDVPGLVPFQFSEDGNHVAAVTKGQDTVRVWNLETERIVVSIGGVIRDLTFAAGGRVFVAAIQLGNGHEIGFYDLTHHGRAPRRFPGKVFSTGLAVSPDGGLVAAATGGGQVRLFDPAKGALIETLEGHLNAVAAIAFSADGRRLMSTCFGMEAVKLWDLGTRQELLTLGGTGSLDAARWSADGDVILVGPPWQAWRAPSWEEIAAAEAKETAAVKQP